MTLTQEQITALRRVLDWAAEHIERVCSNGDVSNDAEDEMWNTHGLAYSILETQETP